MDVSCAFWKRHLSIVSPVLSMAVQEGMVYHKGAVGPPALDVFCLSCCLMVPQLSRCTKESKNVIRVCGGGGRPLERQYHLEIPQICSCERSDLWEFVLVSIHQ